MSKLAKALSGAAGNAGGTEGYVEDVFSTYLYTGTGAVKTITNGIDLDGEGGVVWIKDRSGTEKHVLAYDENKFLSSNTTDAVTTNVNYVQSFNSDGFQVGAASPVTASGSTFASWTFRKAEKFFDVVTYTGNGTAGRTVAHNLGSVPAMMIVKCTNASATEWIIYHTSLGATKYLLFTTGAAGTFTNFWNDTAPTDSVFSLGVNGQVNGNGDSFVAYLFASDAGGYGDDGTENIIKCGSVTTDGSGNASVDVGFEPQWCLWKCVDAAGGNEHGNWRINDVMRGWPVPDASNAFGYPSSLYPNTNGAETISGVDGFVKSATGFGFGQVQANKTYIYVAIRRPMKTPTAGTEVFAPVGATTTAPLWKSSFPVDMGWYRYIIGTSASTYIGSRLTGTDRFETSIASLPVTDSTFKWDYMNGWFDNSFSDTNYVGYNFKRGAGFMDVISYAGNSTAGTTQAHNLGVVPELIIWKTKTGTNDGWITYSAPTGVGYYIYGPSGSAGVASGSLMNSTLPTASVITLSGNGWNVNNTNSTYIALLFATLAGISKVGSYTGTGADLNVDCGFTGGARFILIKRTDTAGDWFTYDSFRGITAGNDPYLLLNSTAAQVTNTDYIDPLNAGFTVTSSAPAGLNASSGTYIFLAIA